MAFGEYYELSENLRIKQPWSNKVSTGNTRSSKMMVESINPDNRWSGRYAPGSTTWAEPPSPRWIGRAAYPYRQSAMRDKRRIVFGPHNSSNTVTNCEYALAEEGYGAQPGKRIEGGQPSRSGQIRHRWIAATQLTARMTENYLTEYGYPDYVNSDVRNVTQVAHKAFTAYLGEEPQLPVKMGRLSERRQL
ncbi:MAG: hypothetical protein R3C26_18790 [Calditrichia bacterium]